MRTLLFLVSVVIVASLVNASPIDPARWLINRPTEANYQRSRRSPQFKGEVPIKGRVQLTRTQPSLRKGEYVCGNKICRLQPGEVPRGCDGICQHLMPLLRK